MAAKTRMTFLPAILAVLAAALSLMACQVAFTGVAKQARAPEVGLAAAKKATKAAAPKNAAPKKTAAKKAASKKAAPKKAAPKKLTKTMVYDQIYAAHEPDVSNMTKSAAAKAESARKKLIKDVIERYVKMTADGLNQFGEAKIDDLVSLKVINKPAVKKGTKMKVAGRELVSKGKPATKKVSVRVLAALRTRLGLHG